MTEQTRTFPAEVYQDRIQHLQDALCKQGLAGMVLMGRANRLYLTGFGSDGGSLARFVALCLPADGDPVYILSDIDKKIGPKISMFPFVPLPTVKASALPPRSCARGQRAQSGLMQVSVPCSLRMPSARQVLER